MGRRLIAIFGLLFLQYLAVGCCTQHGPIQLPEPQLNGPQRPVDVCVPGVWNFGVVSKDVWRGATPSAEGFRTLAALGVKTVIHLGEHNESNEIPAGVKYVRLPISAFRSPQVDVYAVLEAIQKSPKPVFIHCYTGADRTGVAIGAYRMTQGESVRDACKELSNFHVKIWFYWAIKKRFEQLEKEGLSPKWWAEHAVRGPTSGEVAGPN
jgi:protein tyrosine phosphatase (PTP) superfamily phosphohydrolase (DUF442 family)